MPSPYEHMMRERAKSCGASSRPDLLYPRPTGDGKTLEIVSVQNGDITLRTYTKAEAVRFATRILAEADGLED